jgi:hypothetical protein
MKLQAHLPTVSIGARDWRAATIALASLCAASILILAIQSGFLLDNPLPQQQGTSPIARSHISVTHSVSLELHLLNYSINPARQFSVAHPLPAIVASPQRFSIGIDERAAFEAFGDAALRDMVVDKRAVRALNPHNDRLLLMLMLLRLHPHRS